MSDIRERRRQQLEEKGREFERVESNLIGKALQAIYGPTTSDPWADLFGYIRENAEHFNLTPEMVRRLFDDALGDMVARQEKSMKDLKAAMALKSEDK